MSVDEERFRVEERRRFGPFYSVRIFDTVAGREVPLFRGGSLLLGHSSVQRAVKNGIERYLREPKA